MMVSFVQTFRKYQILLGWRGKEWRGSEEEGIFLTLLYPLRVKQNEPVLAAWGGPPSKSYYYPAQVIGYTRKKSDGMGKFELKYSRWPETSTVERSIFVTKNDKNFTTVPVSPVRIPMGINSTCESWQDRKIASD